MKKSFMSRVLAVTLSAAMAFSLSSANLVTAEAASKPTATSLTHSPATTSKKKLVVLQGGTQKLTVKSVKGWKLTATSSNKKYATVSVKNATTAKPTVTIKGVTAGKNATITLKAKKGTKTVTAKKKIYVYVGKKSASVAAATVKAGESTTLTLKTSAMRNTWKITKAVSDNEDAAKVTATAAKKVTVEGVKEGSANITVTYKQRKYANKATATGSAKTASATVTVTAADTPAPTDVAVTGVTLSSTTPKVGDVVSAKLNPENATNVTAYAWYALDSAESEITADTATVGTTKDLTVTAAMIGKYLKVVVTDADGKTYPSNVSSSVSEDASSDVSLVDDFGLQSDGTAIIGDKLRVSYGVTFGVPTNVTWYKDGAVVATNSVGDQVNNALEKVISASEWGTGVYKVSITNASGKVATSNEIIVTDKEEAAKITSFTLEDDYTDGEDISYSTTDKRVVATVTMKKNYGGKFSIYKVSDSKYTSALTTDTLTTSTDKPAYTAAQAVELLSVAGAAGTTAPGVDDEGSILTSNQITNYQVLQTATATLGRGYGYIAHDGTVTYKWVLDDTGVDRGTEYVVCFNQDSISTDTPGSGTANVSEKTVAPYVTAPGKIAVTKIANGSKPEVTFQDTSGNALTWFGYKNSGTAADQNSVAASDTTTLADAGVDSASIWSATAKSTDTKNTSVTFKEYADSKKAGNLLKGVWTGVDNGTNIAYWFATCKLKKGIFGADAVTLTSEAVPNAQDAASDIDLVESKTTATTAVVHFKDLRVSGTVYIVQGTDTLTDSGAAMTTVTAWTNSGIEVTKVNTAKGIFGTFDRNDITTYVAKASVAAGAESVEVPNAISDKLTIIKGDKTASGDIINGNIVDEDGDGVLNDDTWRAEKKAYGNNSYIAVFIPDDEVNYGMVYTEDDFSKDSYTSATASTTVKSPLRIRQEITTADKANLTAGLVSTISGAAVSPSAIVSIGGIQIKDQFGLNYVNSPASIDMSVDAKETNAVANIETYGVSAVTATSISKTVYLSTRGAVSFYVVEKHATPGALATVKATCWDKGDGVTITVPGLANLTVSITANYNIKPTTNGLLIDNKTSKEFETEIKVGATKGGNAATSNDLGLALDIG